MRGSKSVFISFIILVLSTVAFAQESQPTTTAPAPAVAEDEVEKPVWVDVRLGWTDSGSFADAVAQSYKKSRSTGVTVGIEPFHGRSGNSLWDKMVRNMGVSLGYAQNQQPPYDLYLGTIVEAVPFFEQTRTCGGEFGNGKKCVPCFPDNSGVQTSCTVEDVFGRVESLKYVDKTFSVGMYFPKKIHKLVTQWGLNTRVDITKEGTISNDLRTGVRATWAGTLRLAYPVYSMKDPNTGEEAAHVDLVAVGEKSFFGTRNGKSWAKNDSIQVGASLGWSSWSRFVKKITPDGPND